MVIVTRILVDWIFHWFSDKPQKVLSDFVRASGDGSISPLGLLSTARRVFYRSGRICFEENNFISKHNVTLRPFNHKNYRGLLNDSRCRGIDLRVVSGVDLACNFSGLKISNYMLYMNVSAKRLITYDRKLVILRSPLDAVSFGDVSNLSTARISAAVRLFDTFFDSMLCELGTKLLCSEAPCQDLRSVRLGVTGTDICGVMVRIGEASRESTFGSSSLRPYNHVTHHQNQSILPELDRRFSPASKLFRLISNSSF